MSHASFEKTVKVAESVLIHSSHILLFLLSVYPRLKTSISISLYFRVTTFECQCPAPDVFQREKAMQSHFDMEIVLINIIID